MYFRAFNNKSDFKTVYSFPKTYYHAKNTTARHGEEGEGHRLAVVCYLVNLVHTKTFIIQDS